MGKKDSSNQMDTNNQVAQQQLAQQQAQLNQYNAYVKNLVANGGYNPDVRAALNTNAIQSTAQGYQGVGQALNTNALSRGLAGGGTQPGGGGYLRGYGNLLSSEEQQKSQLLNNVVAGGQQNINAAEGGVLTGAGINSNAGSSALGQATSAANNSTNATTGLVGSIVGGGLGVLGKVLNPIPGAPCWVAAELYGGWLAPETVSIRHWLLTTWWMQPFVAFYRLIGQEWALLIQSNMLARRLTKRLFDVFLRLSNGIYS